MREWSTKKTLCVCTSGAKCRRQLCGHLIPKLHSTVRSMSLGKQDMARKLASAPPASLSEGSWHSEDMRCSLAALVVVSAT